MLDGCALFFIVVGFALTLTFFALFLHSHYVYTKKHTAGADPHTSSSFAFAAGCKTEMNACRMLNENIRLGPCCSMLWTNFRWLMRLVVLTARQFVSEKVQNCLECYGTPV